MDGGLLAGLYKAATRAAALHDVYTIVARRNKIYERSDTTRLISKSAGWLRNIILLLVRNAVLEFVRVHQLLGKHSLNVHDVLARGGPRRRSGGPLKHPTEAWTSPQFFLLAALKGVDDKLYDPRQGHLRPPAA
jgi:hypothetical protein